MGLSCIDCYYYRTTGKKDFYGKERGICLSLMCIPTEKTHEKMEEERSLLRKVTEPYGREIALLQEKINGLKRERDFKIRQANILPEVMKGGE